MYCTSSHLGCTNTFDKVVILPHNLHIVDYVIGVPGSPHDSNTFSCTHIYRHPETFLGADEWIWADSAYPSLPWCIVPFKRSTTSSMPARQKIFNQHLSRASKSAIFSVPSMLISIPQIRVHSEHFFGSLKGRFQSLCKMRFQIQNQ